LFFSLLNFKLFFQLLNVKYFIVVLRLIIYARFLAFSNLKRFSLHYLGINLYVCVNHAFILIVNRLISICIILLGIFNYLLIKAIFFQNCIIWLWIMIIVLSFSSQSSQLLLRISNYYMASFSLNLIKEFLSMASNLGTWSCPNIFLNFLPIFPENL
jgi:hypothetical protein